MESEVKSPEISKNGRISKQKTVIFIVIGAAVVILIIVGIIIGVSSNKNGAEPELIIQGKRTNYKRQAVPGDANAYRFIPFFKSTEGEQINYEGFLNKIDFSNNEDDVANDFINVLKNGSIFDEYTFESPLSNASHFEFKLRRSKGLGGKSPSKPEICKTEPNKIHDTSNENKGSDSKILVFPCPPPSGSDDAKYSTLASFVRDGPTEEVKKFFKRAFKLLLNTFDDNTTSVKNWCLSTSEAGWVQGIIDSNSNSCYTT